MKVLLAYPEFPTSYWGFQYGLPLTGRKATLPPLGLITLAALLPREWELRLVDLNVTRLRESQLKWADAVFVGGMRVQAPSIHEVVRRASAAGRRAVVGGPAPTTAPAEFADADVIFQGEAEGRIDELLAALQTTRTVRLAPRADSDRPSMQESRVPRFDLLDLRQYASMSVQYSRGCPFSCEFCDIIEIFGRRPRVKTNEQVFAELDALLQLGYRGSVFFVDDNFIGNKPAVKGLLPDLARWQQQRGYPFELYTEASVNLASDETLIASMVQAGFTAVFLGIETPSPETLAATNKQQNTRLDLGLAVERLTGAGLEVLGGFIVGFDGDGPDVFESQLRFISSLPIPLAMVGLLTALPGTALWRRLEHEGRLRALSSGDQFGRTNFEPKMDEETLLRGYAELLGQIYTPQAFYQRCEAYVDRAPPLPGKKKPSVAHVLTFLRTVFHVGLRGQHRRLYWRLLVRSLRHAPHTFAWAIGSIVQGEHLIRYTREDVLPRIEKALGELRAETPASAAAEAHDRALNCPAGVAASASR
jgi:radical SAM superfamily enzyme YgiQ (UPF0313 family)